MTSRRSSREGRVIGTLVVGVKPCGTGALEITAPVAFHTAARATVGQVPDGVMPVRSTAFVRASLAASSSYSHTEVDSVISTRAYPPAVISAPDSSSRPQYVTSGTDCGKGRGSGGVGSSRVPP